MADDPKITGSDKSDAKAPRTRKDMAEFDRRIDQMADYANFLLKIENAEHGEQIAELEKVRATITDPLELEYAERSIKIRQGDLRDYYGLLIGLTLLAIIIAVAVFYFGRGDDLTLPLAASDPEDTASLEDVLADTGDSSALVAGSIDGVLSGRWRVFSDDTKAVALLDVEFGPGGRAEFITLPESDKGEVIFDSWKYSEDGLNVEIEIGLRMIDAAVGVDVVWNTWMRFIKEGEEMHGQWDVHWIPWDSEGQLIDMGIVTWTETLYATSWP